MAGDWIPYDVTLPRKREIMVLSRAAGVSPRETVAMCLEFWAWASEQSVDGRVDGLVDADLLQTVSGSSAQFWSAMLSPEVGWLRRIEGGRGGFALANFDRWMSNGAKARLQKTKRQQKWRGDSAPVDALVDAPVDAPVDARPSTKRLLQDRTVQESKEDGEESAREEGASLPNPEAKNGIPPRTRTYRPGLTEDTLRQLCELHEGRFGGPADVPAVRSMLDALRSRGHSERKIVAHWWRFLDPTLNADDPRYLTPRLFAQKFALFAPDAPPQGAPIETPAERAEQEKQSRHRATMDRLNAEAAVLTRQRDLRRAGGAP